MGAKNFAGKISGYEENVRNGNLLVIDFAPFYVAALYRDLTPYQQVQERLSELQRGRKNSNVRFVGDATGFLFTNGHFDQCRIIEEWWQKVRPDNVTTLCLFQRPLLERYPFSDHKHTIFDTHDLSIGIDALRSDATMKSNTLESPLAHEKSRHQIEMLIVEPDPDTRFMYEKFTRGLGIDCTIVRDGAACLQLLSNRQRALDIVILDTHITDLDFVNLATEIRKMLPLQRIVLTGTNRLDGRQDSALAVGIREQDLLIKPFRFTQLLALVSPKEPEKSSTRMRAMARNE